MKETELWKNTNTSSTFVAQTIILSQDIDNFDYLKINYKPMANSDAHPESSIIISVTDFKKCTEKGKIIHPGFFIGMWYSDNNVQVRVTSYIDSTHIKFDLARATDAVYSTNARVIPKYVYGMK